MSGTFRARFAPTLINSQPRNVSGIVNYRFALRRRIAPGKTTKLSVLSTGNKLAKSNTKVIGHDEQFGRKWLNPACMALRLNAAEHSLEKTANKP